MPSSGGIISHRAFSTFAGSPYYIDLDLLVRDKLLKKSEIEKLDWGSDPERTDYARIFQYRFSVLRKAFARGRERFLQEVKNLAAFREDPSFPRIIRYFEENVTWKKVLKTIGIYVLFFAVCLGIFYVLECLVP